MLAISVIRLLLDLHLMMVFVKRNMQRGLYVSEGRY
jgi:hypothetical protein